MDYPTFHEAWREVKLSQTPEPIGPEDDPTARLLGRLTIGSTDFHLELFAVHEIDHEQRGVLPPDESYYEAVADAIGGTGPFETLTINGRTYVLVISPFCT
jgi:hypothetical protein